MDTRPKTQETELEIRDSEPSELAAIGAMIRAAYAEYESSYPPEAWQRYYGMIGELGAHAERAEIIVAVEAGEIAGSVIFYPDGRLSGQGEWPEGWAGVLRLAVRPDQRGRGLGALLLEECVRRARARGIGTLALHTTDWMAAARAMYERRGFMRDPSFDFVPRSGIQAYGYRLDLGVEEGADSTGG